MREEGASRTWSPQTTCCVTASKMAVRENVVGVSTFCTTPSRVSCNGAPLSAFFIFSFSFTNLAAQIFFGVACSVSLIPPSLHRLTYSR